MLSQQFIIRGLAATDVFIQLEQAIAASSVIHDEKWNTAHSGWRRATFIVGADSVLIVIDVRGGSELAITVCVPLLRIFSWHCFGDIRLVRRVGMSLDSMGARRIEEVL